MTFKEFSNWCNMRAADGCWGYVTACICIEVIHDVRKQPFWKREKYWRKKYEDDVATKIVNPTNAKIREVLGNNDE